MASQKTMAELCALALWQLAKYSSRSDGCLPESSNDSNWPLSAAVGRNQKEVSPPIPPDLICEDNILNPT
jgi:hypothetical protein